MRFLGRYFLTIVLFFGTTASLYAAEPLSNVSTIKIIYSTALLKKALEIGWKYIAVPELLILSWMSTSPTKAKILQGIATGIAGSHGIVYLYNLFKRSQLEKQVYTTGEIPIPLSLQSDNVIVKHLRSYQQQAGGCGWYMLMNACALQELVEQGKEITAAAIANNVRERIAYVTTHQEEFAKIIKKQSLFEGALFNSSSSLSESRIIALAEYVHVRDYYVISMDEHGSVFFNGPSRTMAGVELKENHYYRIFNLKEACTKLKEDKAIVKHIFLCIPAAINGFHWTLLTLINHQNEKPMIIYMDSNNEPLYQCSIQYVVPFFVQKVIHYLIDA